MKDYKASVCIAAYNEEKTIDHTLNSILEQTFPGDLEILVCANACKDRTAEIVNKKSLLYSNIRLITTETKGKPNAWNILRENASSNYIFFADADVYVDKDAFKILYNYLQNNPNLTAVGASCVPYIKKNELIKRMLSNLPGLSGCLVGRLYLADKSKLDKDLKRNSFDKIPEHIILEDLWLSVVIGKDKWRIIPEAKVHYMPYSFFDNFKIDLRNAKGELQITKELPHLWYGEQFDPFLQKMKRRYDKLKKIEGFEDKMIHLAGFVLNHTTKKIIRAISKYSELGQNLESWATAESSKNPINLEPASFK